MGHGPSWVLRSFPENTLAAFEAAVRFGADALELDVRLTADGVPVVFHDERLERTTDGQGLVRETPSHGSSAWTRGRGEARASQACAYLSSRPSSRTWATAWRSIWS